MLSCQPWISFSFRKFLDSKCKREVGDIYLEIPTKNKQKLILYFVPSMEVSPGVASTSAGNGVGLGLGPALSTKQGGGEAL